MPTAPVEQYLKLTKETTKKYHCIYLNLIETSAFSIIIHLK